MEASDYLGADEARALYVTGDAAHDFDHVLRVVRMAVHIAEEEGADQTVVRLAALLHDVPVDHIEGTDADKAGRDEHHLAAADYARGLLQTRGLGTEETANVVHSIEAHRFRDRSIQPQTLEAKCVYDADKLDSMGAIGIGRVFVFAGAHGNRLWTAPVGETPGIDDASAGDDYTPVHEYVYKLDKLLGELHTETARRIGRTRHEFMGQFFKRLDSEMAGLV